MAAKKAQTAPVLDDPFASAKVIVTPAQKGKGGKDDRPKVVLGRDWDTLGAVRALGKALKTFGETLVEPNTKIALIKEFIKAGREKKGQPTNPEVLGTLDEEATKRLGIDTYKSGGNGQLKCRPSNRPIAEDRVPVLREMGIPLVDNILQEESFFINSAAISNPKVKLMLIEMANQPAFKEALGGQPLFLKQERVVQVIASDECLNKVFQLGINDDDKLAEILADISDIACAPKVNNPDIDNIFAILKAGGLTLKDKKKDEEKKDEEKKKKDK